MRWVQAFYSCTLIFMFAVGHRICILHHSKPAFQQVFHFSSTTVLADVPTAVKVDYSEIIFIRLLHLLAHHPDFAVSLEQLSDFAKWVDGFRSQCHPSECIPQIYRFLSWLSSHLRQHLSSISSCYEGKDGPWCRVTHLQRGQFSTDKFKMMSSSLTGAPPEFVCDERTRPRAHQKSHTVKLLESPELSWKSQITFWHLTRPPKSRSSQ